MILFYDMLIWIFFCLPTVLVVFIISLFFRKTTEVSISIIAACATAFNLYIAYAGQNATKFGYAVIALITGGLSVLILHRKYSPTKNPLDRESASQSEIEDSSHSEETAEDYVSENQEAPVFQNNVVAKSSTTIYKVIIGILSCCLFGVIMYLLCPSDNVTFATDILSILLTVVVCLFMPIVLIVMGKKFSNSKLILISVINGGIVWILSYFLSLMVSPSASSGGVAACIWSTVGYLLMRWKLLPSKASAPSIKRLRVLSLVLAIIVSCLFWVLAFFSTYYYVSEYEERSEYSNSLSEAQTESYEKGFEEGFYAGYDEAYADQISAESEKTTENVESNYGYVSPDSVEQESEMISSGDYVYWNGTGYYHSNKSCSRAEDAKIYLRSQLDETSIQPCGICYQY